MVSVPPGPGLVGLMWPFFREQRVGRRPGLAWIYANESGTHSKEWEAHSSEVLVRCLG
jgi:hypothetical protein